MRVNSFFSLSVNSMSLVASGPVPGGPGLTSFTVTRNTSSVSSFWKRVLLNSAPRMGMSPSRGILDTV
jgi:hypothetical protein